MDRFCRYFSLPLSLKQKCELSFPSASASHEVWSKWEGDKTWPMHVKKIDPFSPSLISDICSAHPETKEFFAYLSDPSKYEEQNGMNWSDEVKFPDSELTHTQIQELVDNGLAEEIGRPPSPWVSYLFLTPEQEKKRWRVVHDCLYWNVQLPNPPNPCFTPVKDVRRLVGKYKYACTFDFKSWYYQFVLEEAVSAKFVFRVGSRWFRFVRLPMGFKWSALLAQLVSQFLATPPFHLSKAIHTEVYIDNVLFASNSLAELNEMKAIFVARCQKYGVTLSEEGTPSTIVTYRGMVLDFSSSSVCVKPSWIEKFSNRWHLATGIWAEWRSLIGMAAYAMAVLAIDFASAFHVWKWYARHAAHHPKSRVTLWVETEREWTRLVTAICANCPTAPISSWCDDSILCSDACRSAEFAGWGAICVRDGRVFAASGRFPRALVDVASINELEVRAASLCVDTFRHFLRPRSVVPFFCDSQVAIHVAAKSSAASFRLNSAVVSLFAVLRSVPVDLALSFVPTTAMPADGLSRGLRLSSADVQLAHLLVQAVDPCVTAVY